MLGFSEVRRGPTERASGHLARCAISVKMTPLPQHGGRAIASAGEAVAAGVRWGSRARRPATSRWCASSRRQGADPVHASADRHRARPRFRAAARAPERRRPRAPTPRPPRATRRERRTGASDTCASAPRRPLSRARRGWVPGAGLPPRVCRARREHGGKHPSARERTRLTWQPRATMRLRRARPAVRDRRATPPGGCRRARSPRPRGGWCRPGRAGHTRCSPST